ncbi:HEAT-like repeat [Carpediemonas membranifera]|uniref:HEAT-like repeat n=1 Tax=Carpediemonas membranifera TaxID=201153 RepID=A0A8J6E3F6_9EUKA|nr:HEAT-like repeat [Carpediemonas membranifera]|eukprot:KAG9395858.1 HEAT-like repeat [Carpediemonas membranifera]
MKREHSFASLQRPLGFRDSQEAVDTDIFEDLSLLRTDEDFALCADRLEHGDIPTKLQAAVEIRRTIATAEHGVVDSLVQVGVIPIAIALLGSSSSSRVRLEAAWLLTTVGEGEYAAVAISEGALAVLYEAMSDTDDAVETQALWALATLASSVEGLASEIAASGFMDRVATLLDEDPPLDDVRTLAWSAGVIAQSLSGPDRRHSHAVLPPLGRTLGRLAGNLGDHDSDTALVDLLIAVAFISHGGDSDIAAVCQAGIVPSVVDLVAGPRTVATSAIRVLGNITSSDDNRYIDVVIDALGLAALVSVLATAPDPLKREALWALANVAAGTPAQLTAVLNEGALPLVIRLAEQGSQGVQQEALFFIRNFTMNASLPQLTEAADLGLIRVLSDSLAARLGRTAAWFLVAMDCIRNMIAASGTLDPTSNVFLDQLQSFRGVDRIHRLATHPKNRVHAAAVGMLEEFGLGDEDEGGIDDGRLSFA